MRDAAAPLEGDVLKITDALNKQNLIDDKTINKVLSEFDTSLERIENGEAEAINNFVKNREDILSGISEEASLLGEDAVDLVTDKLTKPFETLSTDTAKFDKAAQPIIDLLAARVTDSKAYANIAPEMRSALMSGIEGIAKENLSFNETSQAVNELTKELTELSGSQSEYTKALEIAEKAQDSYADSLNIDEYKSKSQEAIDILNNLMSQYENRTDSYGQSIKELLNNEIERIKNFTEEVFKKEPKQIFLLARKICVLFLKI